MLPGSQVCVSWDFDAANGEGNWTRSGCDTRMTDDPSVTRCECNHLTNFAVLVVSCMQVSGVDSKHSMIISRMFVAELIEVARVILWRRRFSPSSAT